MKLFFNIALFSILSYFIADILTTSEDGGQKFGTQLTGGISFVLVYAYNMRYTIALAEYRKIWSFLNVWRIFNYLFFIYFFLGFLDLPTPLAISSPRRTILAFYIFAVTLFIFYGVINDHINNKLLNIILIVICINGFYTLIDNVLSPKVREGVEMYDSEAGYVFLMILPVFLYKYRSRNLWLVILVMIAIFIAGKRSGMVAIVLILIYALFNRRMLAQHLKLDWKIFLFLITAVFILFILISQFSDSIIYRLSNIYSERNDSYGSGRDNIWLTLLNHWVGSENYTNLLFGNGLGASVSLVNNIAHNDIVEDLMDFGLFGALLHSASWVLFYFNIRKISKIAPYLHFVLMSTLIIWITRSFLSGTIRTGTAILSISIGYTIGLATLQLISNAKTKD